MSKTENKTSSNRFKPVDIAFIGVCAALIAICSWLSIPTTVPFTMQTFAVFFALYFLGGKKGTIAVAIYILIGAVGAPVFAGFKGGPAALFGTTGGYILGFILSGLIFWLFEVLIGRKFWVEIISMILGLAVCYAFGTIWFMTVYARTKGAVTLGAALGWCVIPFIIPDVVKIALAFGLGKALRKLFRSSLEG